MSRSIADSGSATALLRVIVQTGGIYNFFSLVLLTLTILPFLTSFGWRFTLVDHVCILVIVAICYQFQASSGWHDDPSRHNLIQHLFIFIH